jgi:hypothetical protein
MIDVTKPIQFDPPLTARRDLKYVGKMLDGTIVVEYRSDAFVTKLMERFTADGKSMDTLTGSRIVNVPEKRLEGWVNFYAGHHWSPRLWATEQLAKQNAHDKALRVAVHVREVRPEDEMVIVGWRSGNSGLVYWVKVKPNDHYAYAPIYMKKSDLPQE